ncbi:MAG: protoporphyrinogen oxidase [Acidimicrobiia bacterium]|nr:protoporphyrinogen oxidase [Acidimicrobiia bacterium]
MSVGHLAAPPRICVVGAGISGLAAAWEVRTAAPDTDLVMLEVSSRPGGVIRTSQFAGRPVDEAADAFLARVDDGTRLCTELGLADDLVAPASGQAFVYLDGQLVPLPRAQFLGVPLDPENLDPRLLSPVGRAALAADLARPVAASERPDTGDQPDPGIAQAEIGRPARAATGTDCTVGELIRTRLGDETLERLVGPLVGSIHAGDCDLLSVQAAAPALAEAAQRDASLIRALRDRPTAGRGNGASPEPVFWGLRGGMETLIAALVERLAPALSLEEPALALEMRPDGAGRQAIGAVRTPQRSIDCDAVVLAVGARQSAQLVAPWAPQEAALLTETETASVAIVTLAYEPSAVPGVADGSGFLVPAGSEPAITACSWASTKWAHLGGPDAGSAVLRVSLGRHGDDAAVSEPDETLIAAARAGLAATMGISAAPSATRVSRWPDAFPQYAVGHLQRTAAVEDTLGPAGVLCAGSSYHGIGIPACIASGRRAARMALEVSRDGARR